jgi:hypothetical protein
MVDGRSENKGTEARHGREGEGCGFLAEHSGVGLSVLLLPWPFPGGVKFEAIEGIESGQAEEELAWLLGEECAMPMKST